MTEPEVVEGVVRWVVEEVGRLWEEGE